MPFADELGRNGSARGRAGRRGSVSAGAGAAAAPARRSARPVRPCASCTRHPAAPCWRRCRMPKGAKSGEADLARLAGAVQHLSKHKCRVFWSTPQPADIDQASAGRMAGAGRAAHDRRRLRQPARPVRLGPHRPRLGVAGRAPADATCTVAWPISVPVTAISPRRSSRVARGSTRSTCMKPKRVRWSRRGSTWRGQGASAGASWRRRSIGTTSPADWRSATTPSSAIRRSTRGAPTCPNWGARSSSARPRRCCRRAGC